MAIKLEIIDFSAEHVTVAFYWPVPVGDQLTGADDQARTPAGSALSAPEIQDLKDGKLYEQVRSFDTSGHTLAVMKSRLESLWTSLQDEALDAYRAAYRLKDRVGSTWDGASWS